MKYLLASFALAAGCSSGPQYGSPHQPSPAEMQAVSSIQTMAVGSVSAVQQNQTQVTGNAAASLYNTPTLLQAVVTGTVHQGQALHTETDFTACTTVTASSVTFNNCSDSNAYGAVSVNGSMSWSTSNFMCDVSAKYGLSASGVSASGGFSSKANISWTSSTLDGSWSFNDDFSESVALISESASVAIDVNYEKLAWDSTGCITTGTLEVIVKASGNANGQNGNGSGAIKATWTGCNALTVQTATVVK
jgi:hypothetical protein